MWTSKSFDKWLSCWRSRDELIRDVLLWIPAHGRAKAGRPARTYIQQLCEDTGCCPEDLPRAMNDSEEWRERVRDIRATSAIWWWWWWFLFKLFTFLKCFITEKKFSQLLSYILKQVNSLSSLNNYCPSTRGGGALTLNNPWRLKQRKQTKAI